MSARGLASWSTPALAVFAFAATMSIGIASVETVRWSRRARGTATTGAPRDAGVGHASELPAIGARVDPDVMTFLRRWVDAITSTRGREVANFYADRVAFSGAVRDRPNVVANWVEQMSDPTAYMRVDFERVDSTAEVVDAQGMPPTCRDVPRATGSVMRIRLWASADRTSGNRWVPCRHLEGAYTLRLRNTVAGFVICHEGWSLTDAICTSCPNAPACPR